jgi:hypothetical protein
MKIQIEPHTLSRAEERGALLEEIEDTINSGLAQTAKNKRFSKSKVFSFNRERNGKFYAEKKLEVFYVIENEIIITITVYVFYGKF